jgi:hypothetical protein
MTRRARILGLAKHFKPKFGDPASIELVKQLRDMEELHKSLEAHKAASRELVRRSKQKRADEERLEFLEGQIEAKLTELVPISPELSP